jgi:hypothetical protein
MKRGLSGTESIPTAKRVKYDTPHLLPELLMKIGMELINQSNSTAVAFAFTCKTLRPLAVCVFYLRGRAEWLLVSWG